MPECARAYVVCRLEADDVLTPLGTLWCEGWGDAIATARTMYVGPLVLRLSTEDVASSDLWIAAWDKEAKATNIENEAMDRLKRRRRTELKVMAFLQWLYPDPNLRPD